MNRPSIPALVLCCTSIAMLPALSAQSADSPPSLRAGRVEGSVAIDGHLSERAWAAAATATDFRQQRPSDGAPASEITEARVLLGDDALYVALRAHDRDASAIVSQMARRDAEIYSDRLALIVDSYHDRRNGFSFEVNAAGVKVDARITDDSRIDATWDAVWDVAVSRDSAGWTAEFRIPLSQLRFNRSGDGGTWGINFRRQIARRDEVSYWSPVPANGQAFVSASGTLAELPALSPPQRLEVVPYSVARVTRAPGNAQDPFYSASATQASVGADLKFALTPSLTLNATINPDFGQVEADPSVVNLSAYETFLPERRPFFVEGAGLFRVNGPQMFYSRRIGRAPQGNVPAGAAFARQPSATTILGAAKLTGRTRSGWSVGLLQAVTQRETAPFVDGEGAAGASVVEPLTSYTVARVTRDLRGGGSGVGALVTALHRNLDGTNLQFLRENAVSVALDGRHRFGGGRYEVTGTLATTRVSGDTLAISQLQRGAGHFFQRPDAEHLSFDPTATSLGGTHGLVQLQRISGGNWRWGASSQILTPGFEVNDLGFNGSSDRLNHRVFLTYNRATPSRLLRSWSAGLSEFTNLTTAGDRIDRMFSLQLGAQLHNLWGLSVDAMRHQGGTTPDMLRGGPAMTNPGSWMFVLSANTDPRKAISATVSSFLDYQVGTTGYTEQVSPALVIRPAPRIDVQIGPNFTRSRNSGQFVTQRAVAGQPQYVVATVDQRTVSLSTRLNYTFSPTLTLQVYAQPFIASGAYSGFKEVRQPRAEEYEAQFHRFAGDEIVATTGPGGGTRYNIDRDLDGTTDYAFGEPSFNLKQLRSTSVLRWEFRPGSTLFLVWSHDRSGFDPDGSLDVSRDLSRLFDTPGRNVVQVKVSWWLGL